MAEENTQPQQEQTEEGPVFQLVRCYLKDASLEMPFAPEIFVESQQHEPNVDMQFEVAQRPIADGGVYECLVRSTVTVKVADKVMVLCECKQAGIFEIRNLPDEGVNYVLNVNCPAMIYPYLRANVADLMTRSSLPPVHLPEVNFEGLYQQRLAEAQQSNAQSEEVAHA